MSSTLVETPGEADAATAENADQGMYALHSLCMRCGEQGTTRLLLTRIPHFREIVVMAFECPHCGERNNEVQFAGALEPQGARITLEVPEGDAEALNRQVVKSESASIRIPELELDIPPESQRGSLSTVEGVMRRASEELGALQEQRRKAEPETAAKIDHFLTRLESCYTGKAPFTLILEDPAGNSFIQSPCAPAPDARLKVERYNRTPADNEKLGFSAGATTAEEGPETQEGNGQNPGDVSVSKAKGYIPAGTTRAAHGAVGAPSAQRAIAAECTPEQAQSFLQYSTPEEVMTFPAHCSACGAPSETRMYVTHIPYFKEVIIMSTSCDTCGFRSSELKAGGCISGKGKRVCLLVKSPGDLTRDVIKSDTSSVVIPELELELAPGTLGGRVTTVEGLVTDIEENLGKVLPFQAGDSAPDWDKAKWQTLRTRLKDLSQTPSGWHLILDDALANSFIAPAVGDSAEDDPQLAIEEYTRSWEQDEELGLHDMNTEDSSSQG